MCTNEVDRVRKALTHQNRYKETRARVRTLALNATKGHNNGKMDTARLAGSGHLYQHQLTTIRHICAIVGEDPGALNMLKFSKSGKKEEVHQDYLGLPDPEEMEG